ncbi:hypothetical protein DFS34DRAFT_592909 [Phlyctochytrium arcticum]|nr:hypothetical protein DFS34DRAFT_592909 [Phlyctochytrium arcticum]
MAQYNNQNHPAHYMTGQELAAAGVPASLFGATPAPPVASGSGSASTGSPVEGSSSDLQQQQQQEQDNEVYERNMRKAILSHLDSLAPSTKATYQNIIIRFRKWCAKMNFADGDTVHMQKAVTYLQEEMIAKGKILDGSPYSVGSLRQHIKAIMCLHAQQPLNT